MLLLLLVGGKIAVDGTSLNRTAAVSHVQIIVPMLGVIALCHRIDLIFGVLLGVRDQFSRALAGRLHDLDIDCTIVLIRKADCPPRLS